MGGVKGTSKIVEPWSHNTVVLEGTLMITEPWNHNVIGLEWTLKTVEPQNHSTAGLEGTRQSLGCQYLKPSLSAAQLRFLLFLAWISSQAMYVSGVNLLLTQLFASPGIYLNL